MADLQSLEFDSQGFLKIPVGTTAERPTSPNPGDIRFNVETNLLEWYDDILQDWRTYFKSSGVVASGGTVNDVTVNNVRYRIHQFTNTGNSTFSVSNGGVIDYLVVAGGGAGAVRDGAAGGAGGLLAGTMVATGNMSVTVGAGGQGVQSTPQIAGNDGQNSSFGGITVDGGGGGGRYQEQGRSGGSGGGNGGSTSGLREGGIGVPGQGSNGGLTLNGPFTGSGGGGAGGLGGNVTTNEVGGDGGPGLQFDITGTPQFYAGGGGGSGSNSVGEGGSGVGGDGHPGSGTAGSGVPNTGSGGGSARSNGGTGGSGGSGIIVVRYKI